MEADTWTNNGSGVQSHARVSFCVPYPNRGKVRACTGMIHEPAVFDPYPRWNRGFFLGLVLGLTVSIVPKLSVDTGYEYA
jgi:hypothetical protein